jgi:quinol monooxygenase YgiN
MSRERSSEIVSTARVKVRPENRKEFCLTLSSLLDLIRQEEGCGSYRFYGEAEEENAFVLIGEWETREAWNHHLQSDNFAVLLGSLRLLGNRSDVDFKVFSHIDGIEAVTRARCHPNVGTPTTMSLS